jgi:hypothetical protein
MKEKSLSILFNLQKNFIGPNISRWRLITGKWTAKLNNIH